MAEYTVEELENSNGDSPFSPCKDSSKNSDTVVIIDVQSPDGNDNNNKMLDMKTMSPIAEEEMQLELVDDSRETRGSSMMTHCGESSQSFTESIL